MLLFLDFDGVLHPFPMGSSDRHFSANTSLWTLLDRLPALSVVITSTWRERHTFPLLVELLVAHGGRRFVPRFLGVTPVLESAVDYVPGIRQREIEAWLLEHQAEREPYIILDDIEEYFDATCKQLYLVDGVTGLTEKDVEAIALWSELLTK